MFELTQIHQHNPDPSQKCPLCKKTMNWVTGEVYHQDVAFHHCETCDHHIFYGERAFNCHCPACLNKRNRKIKQSLYAEHASQRLKQRENEDRAYLLDDLTLLDKLFLLALTHHMVSHDYPYQEYFQFEHYQSTRIAPSFQLFKQLKNHFIQQNYLIELQPDSEQYYTNLRLHGYRDPDLMTIVEQLRAWFFAGFTQGIPYKNEQDVLETLYTIIAHEANLYCQYYAHKYTVQIYANQRLMQTFKTLLKDLALTQLYYLISKAIDYLHEQKRLHKTNEDFINSNLLNQTLIKYRQQGQKYAWETANLPRPADLSYSMMSQIFIFDFLKLKERAIQQPIWKCWQDILPQLRFFADMQCISCGYKQMTIEYLSGQNISCHCPQCRQQQHYFIPQNPHI